jgi:general secretion pathway protein G
MKRVAQHTRPGFTLVEILIVVVIMGILAAIVVPQFAQSSNDARYSATIQNLQSFRQQIDLYRNQHEDRLPGGAASDNDTLFGQRLTLQTKEDGTVNTGAFDSVNYPYGPYFTNLLPPNPFNGSRVVQNVDAFPADAPGGDAIGWVYENKSGRIKINRVKTEKTPDGQSYWDM